MEAVHEPSGPPPRHVTAAGRAPHVTRRWRRRRGGRAAASSPRPPRPAPPAPCAPESLAAQPGLRGAQPAGGGRPWTRGGIMGAKESRIGFLSYDEALRRGEGEGGGGGAVGLWDRGWWCAAAGGSPPPLCPCQRAVRRGGVWRFLTPP